MFRVLAVVVLFACGGKSVAPPPTPPAPAPPDAPAAPPAPPKVTYPGVPAGATGDQVAWVLDALVNHHGEVDPAELDKHFSAKFLAKVPPAQAAAVLHQLARQYVTLAIDGAHEDQGTLVLSATTAGGGKVRVIAAADATGKLDSLLFAPEDIHFASWDDARAALAAIAPHTQALVAELDKGACKPIHALAATDEMAIGSAFKLYVLLAPRRSHPRRQAQVGRLDRGAATTGRACRRASRRTTPPAPS